MLAGGTTETITHFVGLMRLIDDVVRLRDHYEDPAYGHKPQPWQPEPLADPRHSADLDPLTSEPTRAPMFADGHVALPHLRVPHTHTTPHVPLPPPGVHPAGSDLPPADLPATAFAVPAPTVDAPTPDQLLVQASQVNLLTNDDHLLMVAGRDGSDLHDPGTLATFTSLTEAADTVTPQDLVLAGTSDSDAVALVRAHDAGLGHAPAATGETVGSLGTYVDGVLQPTGTSIDFTLPDLAATTQQGSHNGMTDPGLDANTGSNLSLNAASIFDDHTEHGALAVLGNSYSTDAIVQINVLVSEATIASWASSGLSTIAVDGNSASNAASINHHDLGAGFRSGSYAGDHIALDTVEGDFYDVKLLNQINALSDNDSVVQAQFGSYYTVGTGANHQANEVSLQELNGHYDLIVVQGDYHAANLIYQTNLLLTDSAVLSLSQRGDMTSDTISTGNNLLSNKAAIDDYGGQPGATFKGDLSKAVLDLQHGQLDPELAAAIPGNASGTLHVLFVKGDFYDINVISQTNTVSNVDTVAQYAPDPGTALAPTGDPMHSTLAAQTGGNSLMNMAQIVTVGTTSPASFVAGSQYQASTLIQAGYVDDHSRTTTGDQVALAQDVSQLTGLPDGMFGSADSHPVVTTSAHHQDDLFHGVLA